ncbi:MAG: hypothetical protein O3C67_09305, partial [Cyanobacteria bacterium]|nr:hypothetical protein [Cyanobacteriota bacterium]
ADLATEQGKAIQGLSGLPEPECSVTALRLAELFSIINVVGSAHPTNLGNKLFVIFNSVENISAGLNSENKPPNRDRI